MEPLIEETRIGRNVNMKKATPPTVYPRKVTATDNNNISDIYGELITSLTALE